METGKRDRTLTQPTKRVHFAVGGIVKQYLLFVGWVER